MPAFSVTKRRKRRRRIDTIRLMAFELGVHERTLRRWIVDRPELRPLLRAYRHGKQWRLRVPETDAEFERYKQEVLTTIGPFHRERASRRSSFVKKKGIAFGYDGNEQREQDLFILRAATELKIANARPTRVFKARSKLAEETRTDRTSCWVGTVRIVASNYACGVKDVPNYLDRWVADESVVRRSYWQKRTKMTLVYKNEKGAVEREIEIDPKRELQRELRELKNDARQIRQDWPTREQLDKAKGLVKSNWRKRTLNEAARECADRGQRITGPNLAPLLFLNEYREHAWKANEKQKQLHKETGESVMDPYGRRGISLRLFRERYDHKDIQVAKAVAEGTVRSELENKSEDGDRAAAPRRLWFDVER